MQVLLHIGSHKTATTAIQEFASDNSVWLRQKGLLYPSFDLIGGQKERSHLALVNRIVSRKQAPAAESPERLLAEARRIAEAEELDLLFSAESLFRLGESEANRVMDVLRAAFGDTPVTIQCSLRARAIFAESLYRNRYRAFAMVPEEFDDWLQAASGNFEYERILQRYIDGLAAEVRLLPYAASTRDHFVELFFRSMGIDVEGAARGIREKNPSLDLIDCLAKKIVMNGQCDDRMSRAFNNFALHDRIASPYRFLDHEAESQFTRRFRDENRRLIARAPDLALVLAEDLVPMDGMPVDADCLLLAKARAEAFLATRRKTSKTE